jgi:hypothetical protein
MIDIFLGNGTGETLAVKGRDDDVHRQGER